MGHFFDTPGDGFVDDDGDPAGDDDIMGSKARKAPRPKLSAKVLEKLRSMPGPIAAGLGVRMGLGMIEEHYQRANPGAVQTADPGKVRHALDVATARVRAFLGGAAAELPANASAKGWRRVVDVLGADASEPCRMLAARTMAALREDVMRARTVVGEYATLREKLTIKTTRARMTAELEGEAGRKASRWLDAYEAGR